MKMPAFFRKRKGKILLGVIVFLIALRIALPYILLHYANKTLSEMKGYYGHVNDIDVALLRGAYVLDSFYLNKVDDRTNRQAEFISSRMVDLSLEWRALFKGKLVGELIFEEPSLRFTENVVELDDVAKDTSDFRELLNDFMPVSVNRCEIRKGRIRYINNTRTPNLDMSVTNLNGAALNLRNIYSPDQDLPASIDVTGDVYEGKMTFGMKLNPLAKQPVFDLNTKVEQVNLVKLNDLFTAYGGFDVNRGNFNMYVEAATKESQFTGYVKPIIHDLDVVEWKGQDKEDNFFQKLWESAVGVVGEVLENQKEDQLATKINFRGTIDKPKSNILQAVVVVLQNAFVKALRPSIDNQINLSKLAKKDKDDKGGFLKQLFGSDKEKEEN